jgi:hypothetical protein
LLCAFAQRIGPSDAAAELKQRIDEQIHGQYGEADSRPNRIPIRHRQVAPPGQWTDLLILQMCSNADEGEKIFKYYLILDGYFMEVVSAQIKGVGGLVGHGAPSDQALSKCSDNRLFVILSLGGVGIVRPPQ